MKGSQLALPVLLQQAPRFENFFAGPNEDAAETLQAIAEGKGVPGLWLYGAAASGKSHLLGALDNAADSIRLISGSDCEPRQLTAHPEQVLAIDDVEPLLKRAGADYALMRLIDARRSRGQCLVLAASVAPSRIDGLLPDLRSRFESMAVMGLRPLRDQDRRELLDLHARARGLDLPEEAVRWLLAHLRRDAGTLIAALEDLDQAALTAKRRPTLRFVQQTLDARVQPSLALENGRTAPG